MPPSVSRRPHEARQMRPRAIRIGRAIAKRVVFLAVVVVILRLTGCVESLFYQPAHGPTPPPVGIEGVWFDSEDGTRLYGWWIPAKRPADAVGPAPTVIHVHGNAGNIESHEWFSDHLPKAGFNVFLFDYRGYGQSEGSARRRGPLVADTHAAVDYVLTRSDVATDQLLLYGQSLGGAIGAIVFSERAELRAAVLESPFSSWRRVAASAVGGDPPNIFGRCLAWLVISDAMPPAAVLKGIDRPVLIIHGTLDQIVPHAHGVLLAEAAGPHARLLSLDGGQHNTLKESHPEMRSEMIEFFRSSLDN